MNGHRRAPQIEIVTCENPLARFVPALMGFLRRAFGDCWPAGRPDSPATRLEWIRRTMDAETAAVIEMASGRPPRTTYATGPVPDDVAEAVGRLAGETMVHRRSAMGYVAAVGPYAQRRVCSVPLTHDSRDRVCSLVLVQPAPEPLEMGEPLAALLRGAWRIEGLDDRAQAEVEVLTALRECFGRLPLRVYEHCFETYRRVLESLVMGFEPVVTLAEDARYVGIHSYEALARRDQHARRAPLTALDVAYRWGDQFVVERDRVLAVKAVHAYAEAHAAGPFAGDTPAPGLSINVAVRSLLSDAYADALGRALTETGLDDGRVTLEISERDPIKPEPDEQWLPSPMAFFRSRLQELTARLRVAFAVDDFGVDHASLERIAQLGLTQIKVDRAILGHPRALDELQLVVDIAHDALRQGLGPSARDVVVEGFDGHSEVTLKQIYALRIRRIQGYITEQPARPRLRTLDESVRQRIAAMVRGEPPSPSNGQ